MRAAWVVAVFMLAGPAWSAEHQPVGARFHITVADLPPPRADPSVANPPALTARPTGATLQVPEGFHANLFAEGLEHPRWLTVAGNGDVFLAEPGARRITLMRDEDRDGRADLVTVFWQGFRHPHGLAFAGGYLYVADLLAVWRFPYRPGQIRASGPPVRVTPPGALGSPGGHWTRNLAFSPDGRRFFVAIGSEGNLAKEPEPRATVRVFNADGSGGRTFAAGLRNALGIAFYPGTEHLYVVVNERDGLGDDLPPDYLTRIEDGDFFGWPYAYLGPNPDPDLGHLRPDLVARTRVPDVLFQAHSAPMGLVFYDADQFPEAYRGDAFVALRGSWNRSRPTGYKIVRVPFRGARPLGVYENFATGFWHAGSKRAEVWGRPVGLAIGADGSLLVADETGDAVWRISYRP